MAREGEKTREREADAGSTDADGVDPAGDATTDAGVDRTTDAAAGQERGGAHPAAGERDASAEDVAVGDRRVQGAERMVEIESELRDQMDEDGVREFGRPSGEPVSAEVTGARREGDRVVFTTVTADGREFEPDLPWPDDLSDETEPLVRLLSWYGYSIDEFAALSGETVPLRRTDDDEVEIDLPPAGGRAETATYRLRRWVRRKAAGEESEHRAEPGWSPATGSWSPGLRERVRSFFSWSTLVRTQRFLAVATALGLGVGYAGLFLVPGLWPVEVLAAPLGASAPAALAWLVYWIAVALPSAVMGTVGLVLLPLVVMLAGVRGTRWLYRALFPDRRGRR